MLLLIADAAQNSMAGEYRAVTDGRILVATIVGWEYALDAASYLSSINRLIERPPLLIVKDGKLQEANMISELLSKDDVLSQLRQKESTKSPWFRLAHENCIATAYSGTCRSRAASADSGSDHRKPIG